jgi:carbamoyltransferase
MSAGPEEDVHLQLRSRFPASRMALVDHQVAHAASAYYASGFDEATVLTLDRRGDFRCGARWLGSGNQLTLEKELYFPDSLGDLYGRVTELLGFTATPMSTKCNGFHQPVTASIDLFLEILVQRETRAAPDRAFFDAARLTQGGFSARFFKRGAG